MSEALERYIDQGVGREPADIVLKGGRFFDLVTGELVASDIAISGDRIVGTFGSYEGREEIDITGRIVVPGFIDTHLHIESSLVTPHEFDRCVLPLGITTVVVDSESGPMRMGLAAQLAALLEAEHLPISDVSAEALTRTARTRKVA